MTQTLQNGQTLGLFFELLYSAGVDFSSHKENLKLRSLWMPCSFLLSLYCSLLLPLHLLHLVQHSTLSTRDPGPRSINQQLPSSYIMYMHFGQSKTFIFGISSLDMLGLANVSSYINRRSPLFYARSICVSTTVLRHWVCCRIFVLTNKKTLSDDRWTIEIYWDHGVVDGCKSVYTKEWMVDWQRHGEYGLFDILLHPMVLLKSTLVWIWEMMYPPYTLLPADFCFAFSCCSYVFSYNIMLSFTNLMVSFICACHYLALYWQFCKLYLVLPDLCSHA